MIDTGDSGTATKAAAVADTARTKASDVTSVATDQASQVATSVGRSARQVSTVAASQAQDLIDEAKGAVRRQGENQTQQLAHALGRLRDEADALVNGRPEEAGSLRHHASTVVERLDSLTRRLERGGLEGVISDLEQFARKRPAAFLAGAGLLGVVAGRLVRAGREASSGSAGSQAPGQVQASAGPLYAAPPEPRASRPALYDAELEATGYGEVPLPAESASTYEASEPIAPVAATGETSASDEPTLPLTSPPATTRQPDPQSSARRAAG